VGILFPFKIKQYGPIGINFVVNIVIFVLDIMFLNGLHRHSEWRKIVKKIRRKKIRQKLAKERDDCEAEGM